MKKNFKLAQAWETAAKNAQNAVEWGAQTARKGRREGKRGEESEKERERKRGSYKAREQQTKTQQRPKKKATKCDAARSGAARGMNHRACSGSSSRGEREKRHRKEAEEPALRENQFAAEWNADSFAWGSSSRVAQLGLFLFRFCIFNITRQPGSRGRHGEEGA